MMTGRATSTADDLIEALDEGDGVLSTTLALEENRPRRASRMCCTSAAQG